jgi:V/A-type H+-transporting ATPase subunit I
VAIAAMKRLRALSLRRDRRSLLDGLQRLGCVEVTSQSARLGDPEFAALRRAETGESEAAASAALLKSALDCVSRYDKRKRPLLAGRPEAALSKVQDPGFLSDALDTAHEAVALHQKLGQLHAEDGRVRNQIATLSPWRELDVPLELTGTRYCAVALGVTPGSADRREMENLLSQAAPESFLHITYSDAEQHYLLLLYHHSAETAALDAMKSYGFSRMDFKDLQGTAGANIASLQDRLREIAEEREALERGLSDLTPRRADLELALDAAGIAVARESAAARLLSTEQCDLLEGWVPKRVLPELEKLLEGYDCAWESAEPLPDEEPPILLYNHKLLQPFTMVTKMYSLPKYRNIDPNPLISVFYAVFFGMMFADFVYGLILVAIGALVTVKVKPKGPMMRYMFPLMIICGASSAVWGVLMGGYFSNAIQVVGETFFGMTFPENFRMPLQIFDTLKEPMTVLILAVVMGAVHLLVGMGVKAYLLIRDGKPWDALMDVGSWWLVFAGIGVVALGGGPWVAVVGAACLILTQGRGNKSILGKLFGGVASLYDVTAYLSDLLSYSRLMALGLAGGVLGMVFNTMAAMLGPGTNPLMTVVGVVFFLAIFAFGHVFNLGMNVIGCYVHAARLMYIEYFGKFYEGGGTEFAPLALNTKYVDILEKE